MDEVKLLGNWSSPFTYRVIWALALKNIPYEYVEQDLTNKTSFLLHKKLPLLVHGGKSICESSVILEYIDETWPESPLLPADPLDRADARFWTRFIEDKSPAMWRMLCSSGEEQKKAKRESLEILRILEERGIGEGKFFGGEKIGLVDLEFGMFVEWLGVIEEAIGEKLMEADSFPRLLAWSRAFKETPAIRENRPDRDRMTAIFKHLRDRRLLQPSSELEVSLKSGIQFLELFQCVLELVSFLCQSL